MTSETVREATARTPTWPGLWGALATQRCKTWEALQDPGRTVRPAMCALTVTVWSAYSFTKVAWRAWVSAFPSWRSRQTPSWAPGTCLRLPSSEPFEGRKSSWWRFTSSLFSSTPAQPRVGGRGSEGWVWVEQSKWAQKWGLCCQAAGGMRPCQKSVHLAETITPAPGKGSQVHKAGVSCVWWVCPALPRPTHSVLDHGSRTDKPHMDTTKGGNANIKALLNTCSLFQV